LNKMYVEEELIKKISEENRTEMTRRRRGDDLEVKS